MAQTQALRIRDAVDSDREAIQAVVLGAYEQYAEILPKERWEAYREAIRTSVYGDGPVARIVAEWDQEIVGSVLLFITSEKAYDRPELEIKGPIIRLLSVSPYARGKGIATALIKECVRRAQQMRAEFLHLHTSDMMAAAVRLYEHLGFERAEDKDMMNGHTLVKSFRINLHSTSLLESANEPYFEPKNKNASDLHNRFTL
ncbi:GNAT family N-acetyltransferase [Brevibacillus reuszeri]|uniref:GNAT family N-acetyltransferase n=1 Tax=Brevibacillus reuszeri TaxID=54915 RepID=UPI0028A14A0C|nr:GNAT family N-acetyltransferase [Brevibacillus reuszeri]